MEKVDIIKQALGLIGCGYCEQNIDTVKLIYDMSVEKVLADLKPEFADSYTELVLTGNIPRHPQYLYEYEYPKDCLIANEIIKYCEHQDGSFIVCNNFKDEVVIATNITPAVMRYTKKVKDEFYFTSEFTRCLVIYICSIICYPLTKDSSASDFYIKLYDKLVEKHK